MQFVSWLDYRKAIIFEYMHFCVIKFTYWIVCNVFSPLFRERRYLLRYRSTLFIILKRTFYRHAYAILKIYRKASQEQFHEVN